MDGFGEVAALFRGGCSRRWLAIVVVLGAGVVSGCAQQGPPAASDASRAPARVAAEGNPPAGAPEEANVPASERKIIYTATVNLVVTDFAATDRKIQSLTRELGGFIAEFREDRTYGDRRAGHWVVRTPVKHFQKFLDEVVALGVPETRQIDAQDVTEEYVDLEARLANKRKLEERILELLEKQAGEIKDVIAVETELARVREEIERMEGRLRFLANRVELTTINISAREEFDYAPPQAPTFAGKIRSTWSHSLTALGQAFEALALLIVALVPWLAVLLIVAAPIVIGLTRWRRRKSIVAAEAVER